MFVMLGEMRLSSVFMGEPSRVEHGLESLSAFARVGRGRVPHGDGRALRGRGRGAYPRWGEPRASRCRAGRYAASHRQLDGRNPMPVILWLLGVPLTIVILLMLLHVI
jgi:hypothetical protein